MKAADHLLIINFDELIGSNLSRCFGRPEKSQGGRSAGFSAENIFDQDDGYNHQFHDSNADHDTMTK